MRVKYLAFAALFVASAAAAKPVHVADTSFVDTDGKRVQQLSVVVHASAADVWKALTTDDGFKRWEVPVTHITLGNDGMMESSYSIDAKIGDQDNIKNKIVAYFPRKLLVLQNVQVPRGGPFDPVLIATLRTIITLDSIDATHTRVTEAQVGYGSGTAYDEMYGHFRDGNTYSLQSLAQSFISGPVDWQAQAAKMNASVGKKQ